jgi:hypothetical protein
LVIIIQACVNTFPAGDFAELTVYREYVGSLPKLVSRIIVYPGYKLRLSLCQMTHDYFFPPNDPSKPPNKCFSNYLP